MTTLTDIPVDELRGQAAQARPGHALATAVSTIFVVIGWLAGAAVSGVIFCALAVRYGYRMGRGRDPLTGRWPGEPGQAPPRPSKQ